MTTSWVIVFRDSGKPVFETFDSETVDIIKKDYPEYKAVPILEYLTNLNKSIRENS